MDNKIAYAVYVSGEYEKFSFQQKPGFKSMELLDDYLDGLLVLITNMTLDEVRWTLALRNKYRITEDNYYRINY